MIRKTMAEAGLLSTFTVHALSLPRRAKQALLLLSDVVVILFALWAALALRLETLTPPIASLMPLMLLSPLIAVPVFMRLGLYRAIVRYMGLHALIAIAQAVVIYTALLIAAIYLLPLPNLPRSLPLIHGALTMLLIGGSRALARHWLSTVNDHAFSADTRKHVIVYGAGSAGVQLVSALTHSRELKPVAMIDDDPALHHKRIGALEVRAPNELSALIERHTVTEVLLAMPSASRTRRNEIIAYLEPLPVRVRTLPGVAELAEGKVQTADLREVDIEDLLGRDPVPPDSALLGATLTGKVVMVTGAGGSIGSELCRQIAALAPRSLILFEHSEFALYAIEQELRHRHSSPSGHGDHGALPIIPLLGSVTDPARIEQAIRAFGVQTLFHAAAYKHVPMVEYNPLQGIANNILGTWHTAQAALRQGVETFVLISTDKAVRPTNTMGATKRFAEMILQTLHAQHPEGTRFTMVRFGNVLGSSGSVVPLFRNQIQRDGPVTVTDPHITRYFMTIPEAAQLVIQAGAMGQGSDVFVLDMGEPVKILDLARRMIHLSGLTEKTSDNPAGDIEIVFSGLRPGEKLYEELLIGDNVSPTTHPRILRAHEKTLGWEELEALLRKLQEACATGDSELGRELLMKAVGEFRPQCGNQDVMSAHPPCQTFQ